MSSFVRGLLIVLVVLAAAAGGWLAEWQWTREDALARAFMPGPLGRELGRRDAPVEESRAFRTRTLSGLSTGAEQAWARSNGLTPSLAFSHNLGAVFRPELYDQHPEFFPLEGGVRVRPMPRSENWNPDIARPDAASFAAQAARRYFEKNPRVVSFALGTNDGVDWGESPELRALVTPHRWFRGRPDYAPLVFTFMNRVAEELSRTHPDKYLGCLAYEWSEHVPPFPLHPQVVPFLTADRAQGYDPEFWREELANLSKWGALAGEQGGERGQRSTRRLGLYDYLYGNGFLIPRIHTRLLAEHLRHARAAGFTDYYAEIYPNWGLDGPMPWLAAQLPRNPAQALEPLLTEFYARYFREAAAPMREFFERCEALWMAQPPPAYWLKLYRSEMQAALFPPRECEELRASLDAAAKVASTATTKARVAFVSATFGITERLSALHVARDGLAIATLSAWESPEDVSRALREYVTRREDFVTYGAALRRSEPLALHPLKWDDYTRNDPMPAAVLALLAAGASEPPEESGVAVRALWFSLKSAATAKGWREVLANAALTGPVQPARTVAGLRYGVELPTPWQSRAEPAEHHRATVSSAPDGHIVRIEGTVNTRVSQSVPLTDRWVHRGRLEVRGRLSPSSSVSLVVGFLDASNRHFGVKAMRLPVGEWPDWVALRQVVLPPSDAVRIELLLRVQNQAPGDWVEARNFSLTTPSRP